MNLLHIVHYPVFGGPHNQALRLAAPLEARGWHTTVAIPDEPGNAEERLRAGGLDVVTLPLGRLRARPNPLRQARYALRFGADIGNLRRLIRQRRIDLVLLAGHVNIQGAIAARLEGVPVVWQVLDTRTPAALDEGLLRLSRRLADAVMTTGELIAERHKARLGSEQRVVPFYPPVDCREFAPEPALRAEVRREWGLSDSDFVMGTVANVNPQKGIDLLVACLAGLKRQRANARLVIVGAEYENHAGYSAALRRQMAASGLSEGRDVLFLGARADVSRQLQGFDVFCLGSEPRSEGTPTSIIEAMACGLPVIATDVGAVAEMIDEGENGFVAPPRAASAMTEKAVLLAADGPLRQAMGQAAREAALRRFDIDRCLDAHLRAFDAAIEHRRGAAASLAAAA